MTPTERTSDRQVLEAVLRELEAHGPQQFRLKRVAARANVSIGLLTDHFGNREGLIMAAALFRTSELMHNVYGSILATDPENPLLYVPLEAFIESLTAPELWRDAQAEREEFLRLSGLFFANREALDQFDLNREFMRHAMLRRAQEFIDEGLIARGITAVTFTRVIFGILYGQVFFSGQRDFDIVGDDWALALQTVMKSLFARVAVDEGG